MKKLFSLALVIVFSLGFSPAAFSHAGVVSTTPTQDQELTAMPTQLEVTFSEELLTLGDKQVNTISLTLLDGPAVELSNIQVVGATISAQVPEGEYESGTYEVFYTIVSADGHKVSDSYSFSLNAPTLYAEPMASEKKDGVLPTPILTAILILIVVGGIYALRR